MRRVSACQLLALGTAMVFVSAAFGASPAFAEQADTTPPSVPTNVCVVDWSPFVLTWRASSDNVDAPSQIRYLVYEAGLHRRLGITERGVTMFNGGFIGVELVEVYAVDRSGNISEPSALAFQC